MDALQMLQMHLARSACAMVSPPGDWLVDAGGERTEWVRHCQPLGEGRLDKLNQVNGSSEQASMLTNWEGDRDAPHRTARTKEAIGLSERRLGYQTEMAT